MFDARLPTPPLLLGQPIRQLGYFVPDVEAAARRHSALFGSGPFLVHHGLQPLSTHRGHSRPCKVSVALGQWGDQMVEFVQQDSPGPSVFRDIFPEGSGGYGLHHVAIIVNELEGGVAALEAAGLPIAGRLRSGDGTDQAYDAVFADASAALGHMIELYAAVPPVLSIYGLVAAAAEGYDGSDPLRPLFGQVPVL